MNPGKPSGSVRIIAGEWRGRKLPVLDKPGLRPTSDRVRETLFNWLQGVTPGAKVLDLFAGTGALGFEALSRGAASATLLEKDAELVANLRAINAMLGGNATVERADALQWMAQHGGEGFDLVLADPPFADGLHAKVLESAARITNAGGYLYVEAPLRESIAPGAQWREYRTGTTRDVSYKLLQRSS